MSTKFFFGFLISMVSLLGLGLQQPSNTHQEIIISFSDAKEITLETQNNTIAIIKKKLQKIGVNYFWVQKDDQGRLKISYFSSVDTAFIKKVLNQENHFAVRYLSNLYNNQPVDRSDTNSSNYYIDVFEIPKTFENPTEDSGLVIQLLSNTDRLFKQNLYDHYLSIVNEDSSLAQKFKSTFYSKKIIEVNARSCEIPQVRAGPFSYLS